MGYSKINYRDVPAYEQDKEALYGGSAPVEDAMYPIAEALDHDSLEIIVGKADPGWRAGEHSHANPPLAEVYLLVEGEAIVSVDGEEIPMESGDAIRVDPESERAIESTTECTWILITGP